MTIGHGHCVRDNSLPRHQEYVTWTEAYLVTLPELYPHDAGIALFGEQACQSCIIRLQQLVVNTVLGKLFAVGAYKSCFGRVCNLR